MKVIISAFHPDQVGGEALFHVETTNEGFKKPLTDAIQQHMQEVIHLDYPDASVYALYPESITQSENSQEMNATYTAYYEFNGDTDLSDITMDFRFKYIFESQCVLD